MQEAEPSLDRGRGRVRPPPARRAATIPACAAQAASRSLIDGRVSSPSAIAASSPVSAVTASPAVGPRCCCSLSERHPFMTESEPSSTRANFRDLLTRRATEVSKQIRHAHKFGHVWSPPANPMEGSITPLRRPRQDRASLRSWIGRTGVACAGIRSISPIARSVAGEGIDGTVGIG